MRCATATGCSTAFYIARVGLPVCEQTGFACLLLLSATWQKLLEKVHACGCWWWLVMLLWVGFFYASVWVGFALEW